MARILTGLFALALLAPNLAQAATHLCQLNGTVTQSDCCCSHDSAQAPTERPEEPAAMSRASCCQAADAHFSKTPLAVEATNDPRPSGVEQLLAVNDDWALGRAPASAQWGVTEPRGPPPSATQHFLRNCSFLL